MRNPRTTTRHKSRAAIGLLAAGALILAACGGDDDDSADDDRRAGRGRGCGRRHRR